MKTYTVDEMKAIIAEHGKWLLDEGGTRADLSRAYLSGADLSRANLSGADLSRAYLSVADLSDAYLSGAYLSGANLSCADLSDADLSRAYLSGADLSDAYLSGADLSDANLSCADLRGADLSRANLSRANLSRANLSDANLSCAYLSGADLSRANLSRADLPHYQLPGGDLIVWKKVQGKIVTLVIPKDAKRTSTLVGRKCRSEYAMVVEIEGHAHVTSNGCNHGPDTVYEEGKEVRADSYDDNPAIECSHGIHFFCTRKEAEEWN